MISIASVYSAIRNIADDVGKTERAVLRKLSRGNEQVFDHPLYRIACQSPNPEMGPMDLFRALIGSACVFGQGYGYIQRDRYTGSPIHVYPIHPRRMVNCRDANGLYHYTMDGKRVEMGNMIHIKNFGLNGNMGLPLINAARSSLGLTAALESFGSSFFQNYGIPGGILETAGKLDKDARIRLIEQFLGNNDPYDLKVLEQGVQWKQTSVKNNEGQFLESRQFQKNQICELFRIPPHKLMDQSKATMNNMEQENSAYVMDCLMSWFVQVEEEFKRKLCRPDEVTLFLKFNWRTWFYGEIDKRTAFYTAGYQNSFLCPDDIRAMEGLNPRPDGQGHIFVAPQNFSAASALETMPKSQQILLALHAKANGVQMGPDGLPVFPSPALEQEPQTDPAEQTIPETNVPPPPEVIAPGAQAVDGLYGMYLTYGRSMATPLLAAAVRRVLYTESEKALRAAKKGGLASWSQEFYEKHPDHVRAAITPVVMAVVNPLWEAKAPTDEQRKRVEDFITATVTRHVEESRSDLADSEGVEQRVEGWEARADHFAKERMNELLELLGAKQ